MEYTFGHLRDDEHSAMHELTNQAFSATHEAFDENEPRRMENSQIYVARASNDRLASVLGVLPLEQYFGGRRVPMGGITDVTTQLTDRGNGLAKRLLRDAIYDMRDRSQPISALFASTLGLYRSMGWETAGHWASRAIPVSSLAGLVVPDGYEVTVDAWDQLDEIQEIHDRMVSGLDGFLRAGDSFWKSRQYWNQKPGNFSFLLRRDGEAVAFLAYTNKKLATETMGYNLNVTEICGVDGESLEAALALLGRNGMMSEKVILSLPKQLVAQFSTYIEYNSIYEEMWMLRLNDVAAAISARGYQPGVDVCVHLDIADEVVPENAGRWVLEVSNGEGRLTPGGSGEVSLDVRTLAALYSGYVTPAELVIGNKIAVVEREAAAPLQLAFSGSMPWLLNFF